MSDIQYILKKIAEKAEEDNAYNLSTILNVISAALNGVSEYSHIETVKAALQFDEEPDEKAA